MNLSPRDFWDMSVYEISLAINGFKEYNGGKDNKMDRNELDKLMEMYPDY